MNATEHRELYDWPAYESFRATGPQPFFESPALRLVSRPKKGDWDVSKKGNFNKHCDVPYWHEAHHVIPNSVLRVTIEKVFAVGFKICRVRGGLLDAEYNLNHKINVILLPLSPDVGEAMTLPVHRKLPKRSHATYSASVEERLKKVFQKVAPQEPCQANYAKLKSDLESISRYYSTRSSRPGRTRTSTRSTT